MELVAGEPLDTYVREHGLTIPERVELIARVCDAVEHAHQRGVIHRDLKPGNVLVHDLSGERIGQPVILDFGVARATEDSDTGLHTREGQAVGTPSCMSPEQVTGDTRGQDTRTDVYALGVLLYELLTGRPPIDVSSCSLPEAARRIVDTEPRRPSAIEPRLRGDLDTICLKALEKDRAARFPSARALADELRRHLRGEPILARSNSGLYRILRTIARHRALSAMALGLFLALAGFAVYASAQARKLERTARGLDRELMRSQLERGALLTRMGAVEAAEAILWSQLFEVSAAEADLEEPLWALRNLYHRLPCLGTRAVTGGTTRRLLAHPDGQRLIRVTSEGALAWHDRETLAGGTVEPGQPPGWNQIALSEAAGSLFHLGSFLDLYELDGLEHAARLEGPEFEGSGVAALADGTGALLGGVDGKLRLFDLDAWGLTWELALHRGPISAVEVTPEGRIVTLGLDGRLCLIPGPGEYPEYVVQAQGPGADLLRLSEDGCRAVTAAMSLARAWDVWNGHMLGRFSAPNGPLQSGAFVDGGARLVTGGWWALDRWSLEHTVPERVLGLQTAALLRLDEDRGGFVAAHRSQLRTWGAGTLERTQNLGHVHGPAVARYATDGTRLLVCDGMGHLEALPYGDGDAIPRRRLHDQRAITLVGAPGGVLWTGGVDGFVRLWAVGTEEPALELDGFQSGSSFSLDLSADGERVVLARSGGRVELRASRDGTLLERFELTPQEILSVRLSPDPEESERVAATSRDGLVHVRTAQGGPLRELDPGWVPLVAAFHPQGDQLVASGWLGELAIFDLRDGSARELFGHNAAVWDLCFRPGHPDQLLTGSGDGTARLWDVRTGRQLLFLDEFDGLEVASVDFDPTGRRVLLASSDGRVREVDLAASLRCVAGNLEYQLAAHGVERSTADEVRARIGREGPYLLAPGN